MEKASEMMPFPHQSGNSLFLRGLFAANTLTRQQKPPKSKRTSRPFDDRPLGPSRNSVVAFGFKLQRRPIDTVTQSRWLRAIREHVPQMPVTACAMDFGAAHKQASVFFLANHLRINWLIKRRPTGAAVEFMGLLKQGRTTALAHESPGVFREVVVAKSAFRRVFAQDFIGCCIQLVAPFVVGLNNLIQCRFPHVVLVSRLA